ncbi:Ribonuclease H2 subunit A [Tetrabaena socialis]|uniref:Ribonuclease n=1 Tax=Tetrabaena socialis TaxID=47790 RepID=A0A2J7ZP20_9CHLO|nr:Ribonuclease H2 subunit A [Tetrabaena socialis]|eukprot:PNH02011.1 Ribonuclease H2 subunit A [Tetrabaena socialis]
MVYAAAFTKAATDITDREYADSKTLTAEKRAALFHAIDGDTGMGWVAHVQSAQDISKGMLGRDKISLNQMAFEATCAVIRTALDSGANVKHIFVDTVGDADRHRDRLSRTFAGIEFTRLGLTGEVGSGYPGDAATVAWLKQHLHPVFGFPPLVRHSWETCSRLLEPPEAISMKFEADAEEGDGGGPAQQRLNFKRANATGLAETSGLGRATFFRLRKLQRTEW